MNTPKPTVSQAAKDTILACYAAGDNLPVTETLVDVQADIVQRFVTQETSALQAQLDDFIERRKEDLAVVASQQTRLDAARAEIATLRTTLTNVRGENPAYFKHDEFGNQVPAGNMASRRQDEIDEALVRTAKDYEGLVGVPKAEWEALRRAVVNPDREEVLQALRFVFAWLADICLFVETSYEYQNLQELQARAVCAHRQTIEYRRAFSLKTRGEVEKGIPDFAYENAPAAPCHNGEQSGVAGLLQETERLKSDLAAQSAKLSEAEKDTRRLDFLETGYSKFSIIDRLSGRPTRASIDAAIAKGGSVSTEPIGSPEHCERMAKFLADRKDPELLGAVGALNWAAKHIRELTS